MYTVIITNENQAICYYSFLEESDKGYCQTWHDTAEEAEKEKEAVSTWLNTCNL